MKELVTALGKLSAVMDLAQKWAGQSTDWDEDTEQQIADGWTLLALLAKPDVSGLDLDALADEGYALLSAARAAELDNWDDSHLRDDSHLTSSPAVSTPAGEAARPGPPTGDECGPGRASKPLC